MNKDLLKLLELLFQVKKEEEIIEVDEHEEVDSVGLMEIPNPTLSDVQAINDLEELKKKKKLNKIKMLGALNG